MENKPKEPVILEIEWQQHQNILEIDKYINTVFPPSINGSYIGSVYVRKPPRNTKEFKEQVTRWAKDRIQEYEDLIEKVQQLPDDDDQMIKVEVSQ